MLLKQSALLQHLHINLTDVLCMIDLFCLFSVSLRSWINSPLPVWCSKGSAYVPSPSSVRTPRLLLPTSLVILAVGAERLGGDVAAEPPPPGLADAVPDVLVQDAPPVVVAQAGAAVCQSAGHGAGDGVEKERGEGGVRRQEQKRARERGSRGRRGVKMIEDRSE